MTIAAIIQARMTSTRLPRKVLMDLGGKSILERVIERVSLIDKLNNIVVAIPEGSVHAPIAEHVKTINNPVPITCVEGDENNVLERTIKALDSCQADICIRITSDCPFVDPEISSTLLDNFLRLNVDYARLDSQSGYPLGFDTEIVKTSALLEALENTDNTFDKEHVTPYIWKRPEEFSSVILSSTPNNRQYRLVVDEPADYEFAQKLYNLLKNKPQPFTYSDICDVLEANSELMDINKNIAQKAMIGKANANK